MVSDGELRRRGWMTHFYESVDGFVTDGGTSMPWRDDQGREHEQRGHGADAASLRLALLVLAPTGFWATWHFCLAARTVVDDQRRAIGYTTA